MRFLCPEITSNSIFYDCHPHPHNYYMQMLGNGNYWFGDRYLVPWFDHMGLCATGTA